jgi:hypothetical protein
LHGCPASSFCCAAVSRTGSRSLQTLLQPALSAESVTAHVLFIEPPMVARSVALDWADMLLVIADHPRANAGSFRNVAAAHPETTTVSDSVWRLATAG